jgi:UDP-N-acetyl-D-mannosaminuronate dehydrogenase
MIRAEWDEFRMLDYQKLQVLKDKLIIDGRNIYNPNKIKENHLEYFSSSHHL